MPLPSSPWYTFCPLIDSYYDELRHSLDTTTQVRTNRQPIVSSMIPRAHANGCGKPPRNRDREARRRRREASRFEAKITRAAHTGDRPGSRSYLYERAYIHTRAYQWTRTCALTLGPETRRCSCNRCRRARTRNIEQDAGHPARPT